MINGEGESRNMRSASPTPLPTPQRLLNLSDTSRRRRRRRRLSIPISGGPKSFVRHRERAANWKVPTSKARLVGGVRVRDVCLYIMVGVADHRRIQPTIYEAHLSSGSRLVLRREGFCFATKRCSLPVGVELHLSCHPLRGESSQSAGFR